MAAPASAVAPAAPPRKRNKLIVEDSLAGNDAAAVSDAELLAEAPEVYQLLIDSFKKLRDPSGVSFKPASPTATPASNDTISRARAYWSSRLQYRLVPQGNTNNNNNNTNNNTMPPLQVDPLVAAASPFLSGSALRALPGEAARNTFVSAGMSAAPCRNVEVSNMQLLIDPAGCLPGNAQEYHGEYHHSLSADMLRDETVGRASSGGFWAPWGRTQQNGTWATDGRTFVKWRTFSKYLSVLKEHILSDTSLADALRSCSFCFARTDISFDRLLDDLGHQVLHSLVCSCGECNVARRSMDPFLFRTCVTLTRAMRSELRSNVTNFTVVFDDSPFVSVADIIAMLAQKRRSLSLLHPVFGITRRRSSTNSMHVPVQGLHPASNPLPNIPCEQKVITFWHSCTTVWFEEPAVEWTKTFKPTRYQCAQQDIHNIIRLYFYVDALSHERNGSGVTFPEFYEHYLSDGRFGQVPDGIVYVLPTADRAWSWSLYSGEDFDLLGGSAKFDEATKQERDGQESEDLRQQFRAAVAQAFCGKKPTKKIPRPCVPRACDIVRIAPNLASTATAAHPLTGTTEFASTTTTKMKSLQQYINLESAARLFLLVDELLRECGDEVPAQNAVASPFFAEKGYLLSAKQFAEVFLPSLNYAELGYTSINNSTSKPFDFGTMSLACLPAALRDGSLIRAYEAAKADAEEAAAAQRPRAKYFDTELTAVRRELAKKAPAKARAQWNLCSEDDDDDDEKKSESDEEGEEKEGSNPPQQQQPPARAASSSSSDQQLSTEERIVNNFITQGLLPTAAELNGSAFPVIQHGSQFIQYDDANNSRSSNGRFELPAQCMINLCRAYLLLRHCFEQTGQTFTTERGFLEHVSGLRPVRALYTAGAPQAIHNDDNSIISKQQHQGTYSMTAQEQQRFENQQSKCASCSVTFESQRVRVLHQNHKHGTCQPEPFVCRVLTGSGARILNMRFKFFVAAYENCVANRSPFPSTIEDVLVVGMREFKRKTDQHFQELKTRRIEEELPLWEERADALRREMDRIQAQSARHIVRPLFDDLHTAEYQRMWRLQAITDVALAPILLNEVSPIEGRVSETPLRNEAAGLAWWDTWSEHKVRAYTNSLDDHNRWMLVPPLNEARRERLFAKAKWATLQPMLVNRTEWKWSVVFEGATGKRMARTDEQMSFGLLQSQISAVGEWIVKVQQQLYVKQLDLDEEQNHQHQQFIGPFVCVACGLNMAKYPAVGGIDRLRRVSSYVNTKECAAACQVCNNVRSTHWTMREFITMTRLVRAIDAAYEAAGRPRPRLTGGSVDVPRVAPSPATSFTVQAPAKVQTIFESIEHFDIPIPAAAIKNMNNNNNNEQGDDEGDDGDGDGGEEQDGGGDGDADDVVQGKPKPKAGTRRGRK